MRLFPCSQADCEYGFTPRIRRNKSAFEELQMIHRLRLSISNSWLITAPELVLIDSGVPKDLPKLLKAIRRCGIDPVDLKWILHTHGHSDHVGCTRELVKISGAKTAIHRDELERIRAGHHGELHPQDWMARAMQSHLHAEFPPFEADHVFESEDVGTSSLAEFGLEGTWLHTPGHTAGSISFVLENGDAVIGDLFRGHILRRNCPQPAFFYEDGDAIRQSIGRLLETDARRFLPGHFGVTSREKVEKWFGTL